MAGGGFLDTLGLVAGGVADSGSSIFKGLLQGREIAQRETQQRLQRERQNFLDRLHVEHEARQAEQFQQNQARLMEYLKLREERADRPTVHPRGDGRYDILDSGGNLLRTVGTPTPKLPPPPKNPIEQTEADLADAVRRGDEPRAIAAETLLKRLKGATAAPKEPHMPPKEQIRGIALGVLPEVPGMSRKAAQAILDAEEQASLSKEDRLLGRQTQLMEARAKIAEDMKIRAEQRKEQHAEMKNADKRRQTAADLDLLLKRAKGIDDAGLLPPMGTTITGTLWSEGKRKLWDPGNKDLTSLRGLWGAVMIGEVDRGVFDEKGIRAIQAFKANFDMLERMPPYEALKQFIDDLKASIARRAKMPDTYGPSSTLEQAVGSYGGTVPLSPGTLPQPPPGFKPIR